MSKKEKLKNYLLSASVLVSGTATEFLKKEMIGKIYIPNFYIEYFRKLSKEGILKGELGLEELKKLKNLKKKNLFVIEFFGPNFIKTEDIFNETISLASIIDKDYILLVADELEALSCESKDIEYQLVKISLKNPLTQYFDKNTMSIHIKAGREITLKKGKPGEILIEQGKKINEKKVKKLVDSIIEYANSSEDSYIEKDENNCVIAQLEDIRVVIVKPPLSEVLEITAVRPVKKTSIEDYNLDEKLLDRLKEERGILIAGSPGSGKSTFVQAVIDYIKENRIVKTIESPRDLQVSPEITQLALYRTDEDDIRNILLLSRPDVTIFDEIRNPGHISLYADLRLTGIGMLGVIHATKPIDAVHRILNKVDIGLISQVIDTIIFISKGKVEKVLILEDKVKVPTGMQEADLARPVVEVRDFNSKKLLYEIYTYGEQTVVMQVEKEPRSKILEAATDAIKEKLRKYIKVPFDVEVISQDRIKLLVAEKHIPNIIGRQGKNIEKIENELGIKITVEKTDKENIEIIYKISEKKKCYVLRFGEEFAKTNLRIITNNKSYPIRTNKNSEIRINKKSEIGSIIAKGNFKVIL